MKIHKEGYTTLMLTVAILFTANTAIQYFTPGAQTLHNVLLGVSIVLFLLILQFFRSPNIVAVLNNKVILAPADGKVVVIEEVEEQEYFKDRRRQVSIFMSPINVHVSLNPVSGVVKYVKYHAGKYLVAWHPKSSTENERTTIVVESESGFEVLFRQVAGAMAKRIKYYCQVGQKVEQGSEFGFIKFGSRIDVYLPLEAEIKVNIGDKTKGGKTIIAEFV